MKTLRRIFCTATLCLLSCFVFPFYSISASAYVTIEAEIPVYCLEVTDSGNHIYQIKIESENNVSPAPKSDILEITENGTGKFEIDIDEPGTYQYRIYEKTGYDSNIKYDDNIYTVTVFVETISDDDLKYAVVAKIIGKDEKPDCIEFENIVYGDSETVTTTIPVTTVPTETTTTAATEKTTTATKVTTEVTTTVTTTKSDNTDNPITGFIDSVLTGDSFPAHAVRLTMLASVLIAISTFLFKRDNSEEEDKNEE